MRTIAATRLLPTVALLTLGLSASIFAQDAPDAPPTIGELQAAIDAVQTNANIVWTVVCAALVLFMQAGFAMVEAGFTRAKNAGNIMMKNVMDCSLGGLAYWAVGFGLMFGASNGLTGGSLFFFAPDNGAADGQWGYTFWMFQVVFAATAATIVSGAMAERTKFVGYLAYSFFISLLIYPIFGHWAWGNLLIGENGDSGAWLANMGFIDFAGSTVVHSVGGWAALAGAMVIGPRIGKFSKDGKTHPIPGPQLDTGGAGRVHPLCRMVRIQPGLHHDWRRLDRTHRDEHVPGGICRRSRDHDGVVVQVQQA